MTPDQVQSLFVETGALLKGHFVLSSGLHSDQYMQCALVLARPDKAERLGAALARLAGGRPDLVVSPAMGGLIIGQEVARALGVRAYFTERQDGVMTLRRGFSVEPGERVVVVEDVVTTGKSSREVFSILEARGAKIAAWLSVVDRSNGQAGVKSLLTLSIPAFEPASCPQCKAGVPAVKPGSRTVPKGAA